MQFQLDFPLNIKASIDVPSSKSISNRALIISALTPNGILPENLAQCDDTDVTLNALQNNPATVDIKAAGTAMRFLTAYYAVTEGEHIMTGTERMKSRPIHILVDALRSIGADITYTENEGYPPLKIVGKKLEGGTITLDGSVSSQFISALLLIAPTLSQGLRLELEGSITSIPYINMTLSLMKQCGAVTQWENAQTILVESQNYIPTKVSVEADWSAASYWFETVALIPKGELTLPKLTIPSLQGDSKGAPLFKKLGVIFKQTEEGFTLRKGANITEHLEANFKEIPDLVQTFVVTAALLGTTFRFTGVETLRIKETDRIDALINEMRKLGFILKAEGDHAIIWDGRTCQAEKHPVIKTYEDHRMAMAFAPAAILYPELVIEEPMVVTKSYPLFWEDLESIGVKLLKK